MIQIALLWALLVGTPVPLKPIDLARGCNGSDSCTACKNCTGCKHCAKDGGTCGVCKPPKKPSSQPAA